MMESGVCASRCGFEHHPNHPQAMPLTFYERKAA
jgi:bacterioferritin-associated ferredoxin